ncbi:MAG TPA: hypothetical protein VMB34_07010 [Acetobacteraceae bacterium]|nr:hypothetical protein [Acetobacteraceae bacterium]
MTLPALHRVLACLLLAGCALVDQRTFAPAPEAKAAPSSAPAPRAVRVDTRTPLVTVDFSGPPPEYRELLGYAVHAAETRDREVQYDVVAMAPNVDDFARSQQDATDVMRAVMQEGVPSARIHLGLRADPTLRGREVRVYVR